MCTRCTFRYMCRSHRMMLWDSIICVFVFSVSLFVLRLLTSQDNSHMPRLNCQLLMLLSNSAEGNDGDELSYVGVPPDLKGTQAQTIKLFAGPEAFIRKSTASVCALFSQTVHEQILPCSNPFYERGERLWPGDRLNGYILFRKEMAKWQCVKSKMQIYAALRQSRVTGDGGMETGEKITIITTEIMTFPILWPIQHYIKCEMNSLIAFCVSLRTRECCHI